MYNYSYTINLKPKKTNFIKKNICLKKYKLYFSKK